MPHTHVIQQRGTLLSFFFSSSCFLSTLSCHILHFTREFCWFEDALSRSKVCPSLLVMLLLAECYYYLCSLIIFISPTSHPKSTPFWPSGNFSELSLIWVCPVAKMYATLHCGSSVTEFRGRTMFSGRRPVNVQGWCLIAQCVAVQVRGAMVLTPRYSLLQRVLSKSSD